MPTTAVSPAAYKDYLERKASLDQMTALAQAVKASTDPTVKAQRMQVFKVINLATNQISNTAEQMKNTMQRMASVLAQLSSNEFAAFGAVTAGNAR